MATIRTAIYVLSIESIRKSIIEKIDVQLMQMLKGFPD